MPTQFRDLDSPQQFLLWASMKFFHRFPVVVVFVPGLYDQLRKLCGKDFALKQQFVQQSIEVLSAVEERRHRIAQSLQKTLYRTIREDNNLERLLVTEGIKDIHASWGYGLHDEIFQPNQVIDEIIRNLIFRISDKNNEDNLCNYFLKKWPEMFLEKSKKVLLQRKQGFHYNELNCFENFIERISPSCNKEDNERNIRLGLDVLPQMDEMPYPLLGKLTRILLLFCKDHPDLVIPIFEEVMPRLAGHQDKHDENGYLSDENVYSILHSLANACKTDLAKQNFKEGLLKLMSKQATVLDALFDNSVYSYLKIAGATYEELKNYDPLWDIYVYGQDEGKFLAVSLEEPTYDSRSVVIAAQNVSGELVFRNRDFAGTKKDMLAISVDLAAKSGKSANGYAEYRLAEKGICFVYGPESVREFAKFPGFVVAAENMFGRFKQGESLPPFSEAMRTRLDWLRQSLAGTNDTALT